MIKTTKIFGLALCAALAVTACKKTETKPEPTPEPGEVEYSIYVTPTKTAFDGKKTNWVANDAISVFLAQAGKTEYVSEGIFTIAEKDLAESKFSGKITKPLTEKTNYDWYAMYPSDKSMASPAAASVEFGATALTVEEGSMACMAGEKYPMAGKGASIASDAKVTFAMQHLATVIKVTVTNKNTKPVGISNISITAAEPIFGAFTANLTNPAAATYSPVEGKCSATADLTPAVETSLGAGASVVYYIVSKPFAAGTVNVIVNDSPAQEIKVSDFKAGTTNELNVDAPVILDPYPDFEETMFYSFDEMTDELTHTSGASIATTGQKEGTGYLSRTMSGDAEIFCLNTKEPVNCNFTNKRKAHFVFWFYCTDAAGFKASCNGGDIELGCSGDISRQILRWNIKRWLTDVVVDGWNLIDLPLAYATEGNPTDPFDSTHASWFRMYTDGAAVAAERTYGVDALAFYEGEEIPITKNYFHNCDNTDFFMTPGAVVDTEHAQEGTGCVKLPLPAGAVELAVIQRGANIIDAGCNQYNGHLHFKLYISDMDAFATGDGQLELSHSNTADVQEINWNTRNIIDGCKAGWNEIDLKFVDAAGWGSGNDYNPAGTNWMRLYFVSLNKEVTLMLDDIYFYAE